VSTCGNVEYAPEAQRPVQTLTTSRFKNCSEVICGLLAACCVPAMSAPAKSDNTSTAKQSNLVFLQEGQFAGVVQKSRLDNS
jgi:hypothetical protein